MHTLKIGVIGLGFIGAQHIDALRPRSGCGGGGRLRF